MFFLDANALYWYYGRDKLPLTKSNNVDQLKLQQFLSAKIDVNIPASVFMEVIVHFRDKPEIINKLYQFIKNKKLRIYNNCSMFVINDYVLLEIERLSQGDLQKYAESLLNKKITIEKHFAYTFLETIKIMYANYVLNNNDKIEECYTENILFFIGSTLSKETREQCLSSLEQSLIDGYTVKKEEQFLKEKYIELLNEECVRIHMLVNAIEKFLENEDDLVDALVQGRIQALSLGIDQENIMRIIKDSLSDDSVFLKQARQEIIEIYKRKGFTDKQAKYIGVMFDAWTDRGQKLRKNDIFDMFFMGCADTKHADKNLPVIIDQSNYLITFDKKLKQFIQEYSSYNGKLIESFETNI